jgi:hypothetical protein
MDGYLPLCIDSWSYSDWANRTISIIGYHISQKKVISVFERGNSKSWLITCTFVVNIEVKLIDDTINFKCCKKFVYIKKIWQK